MRVSLIILLILLSGLLSAQPKVAKSTSKISGALYISDSTGMLHLRVKEVKVLLIVEYLPQSEIEELTKEKYKLCENDRALFEKYQPKVCYTNVDGEYEFDGVAESSNYILVICDSKIQIYAVSTGARQMNYIVKDKRIYY